MDRMQIREYHDDSNGELVQITRQVAANTHTVTTFAVCAMTVSTLLIFSVIPSFYKFATFDGLILLVLITNGIIIYVWKQSLETVNTAARDAIHIAERERRREQWFNIGSNIAQGAITFLPQLLIRNVLGIFRNPSRLRHVLR
ncbi:Uncharacterised protein r2_g4253 [Pycnogonum litorale]